MDKPTLQELIAQALTVSRITPEPTERAAVLQSVLMILDGPAVDAPAQWRVTTRAIADRALAGELAVERAYRDLTSVMVARATAYAGRADVRAVTALPGEVLERDGALGRQRPNQVAALLAALEVRIDAARRLKLARDRWQLRLEAYRRYERAIEPALEELDAHRQALDDIRLLAGPAPQALPDLELRLEAASRTLGGLAAPSELLEVHVLFTRALQLASSAATLRGRAVTTGELRTAWDASAAAAGSLMLIDRALEELGRVLKAPELN
jgi:hypothetical protein